MRERMDKLAILPFSVGCASYSSIAVFDNQSKKIKEELNPSSIREREQLSGEEVKNSLGFHLTQKPNVSSGLQRLVRGFKSFSQLFVYKEEVEGEMQMEIGPPKDVKHVTHIGWDGCTSTTTASTLDDLTTPPHFLSLASLSLAHGSPITVT